MLYPGSEVDISDLPARYTADAPVRESDRQQIHEAREAGPLPQDFGLPGEDVTLKEYLANIELSLIRRALHETEGVIAQAARRLNVRRTTLVEKMRKYGLMILTSGSARISFQPPRRGRDRSRAPEQIALCQVATQFFEHLQLRLGFDAFGGNLHAEAVGQRQRAAHDAHIPRLVGDAVEEHAVDLQTRDRQGLDIAE